MIEADWEGVWCRMVVQEWEDILKEVRRDQHLGQSIQPPTLYEPERILINLVWSGSRAWGPERGRGQVRDIASQRKYFDQTMIAWMTWWFKHIIQSGV
jgi:hypothetical protein